MKKLTGTLSALTLAAGLVGGAQSASACDRCTTYTTYRPETVVLHRPVANLAVARTTHTVYKMDVATIVAPAKIAALQPGGIYRLRVDFLGKEPGEVHLKFGPLKHKCEIKDWSPNHVTFTLPEIEMLEESVATIDVFRPNGQVARSMSVALTVPEFIHSVEPSVTELTLSKPVTFTPVAVRKSITRESQTTLSNDSAPAPIPETQSVGFTR